jgi:hypothetical protein
MTKTSTNMQSALFLGAFAVSSVIAGIACSGNPSSSADPTLDPQTSPSGTDPAAASQCKSCVQASECARGDVCAQFGGDSFCAAECTKAADCATGTTCAPLAGTNGASVKACVPDGDLCGAAMPGTGGSSGGGSGGGGSSGGSGGVPVDAGGPVVGSIGASGGSISRLYFAVVGDTRPPVINDTKAYPSAVITKIYSDLEALSPRPPFAVTTGDYLFSTGNGTQAAPQLDMYLQARQAFSNVVFPALGNHECTGAVTSNCGTGNKDGLTANYTAFLSKLLAPIGQTSPNYVINVDATDKSWTSKLVFVAGNAWSPSDAAWLETTLSVPTTYTFIVRHEPKAASTAPGCKASEAIMANHPYTLAIVGHTHTYGRTGPRQVTIGNGGAPLTGGANFGFGLIQQRADGAIEVNMVDYVTGKADAGFGFALHADGSAAP